MSTQTTQARSGGKETAPIPRAGLVAWICLLIVYVVWGSTYLAIRVGVETMPPLLMAAARSLVAGLIMFPLGLRRRRSAPLAPRWPSRVQWRACATAGVLLLVGQGVVGVAERTIPSGLAALLVATVPLWLLGLDAGLNRARLGRAQLAGLLVGLAGVALLSTLGGGAGHVSVAGVLIVLGAAGGQDRPRENACRDQRNPSFHARPASPAPRRETRPAGKPEFPRDPRWIAVPGGQGHELA